MSSKKIFSERIREIRKKNNLNQEEFGKIIKISKQAVSEIERGNRLTTIDKLAEVSKYFNVSTDYLLGLSNTSNSKLENSPKDVKILNERLKEIRMSLSLSKETFVQKLGLSKSTITGIETGNYNVTESIIISICNIFNVSEDWLRTGKGEMYVKNNENSILQNIDESKVEVIKKIQNMSYVELKKILEYVKVLENINPKYNDKTNLHLKNYIESPNTIKNENVHPHKANKSLQIAEDINNNYTSNNLEQVFNNISNKYSRTNEILKKVAKDKKNNKP